MHSRKREKQLEEILPGHDAVIHMASFIEVGESVKKPVEFTENNIVGTVKLLEAMRVTGVKKMIFSSGSKNPCDSLPMITEISVEMPCHFRRSKILSR